MTNHIDELAERLKHIAESLSWKSRDAVLEAAAKLLEYEGLLRRWVGQDDRGDLRMLKADTEHALARGERK
jgi:hypothetical protein